MSTNKNRTRTDTIIVAGSLAQKPRYGGHAWVFLQYLLGFRRLGWEVLFLDRLEPDMCVDAAGQPCGLEQSINLACFLEVMERFGLAGAYALFYDRGRRSVGLSRTDVLERCKRSAFLLNVMGFLSDADILAAVPQRVFLDIDPGFAQMWRALELHDSFAGHDHYVTVGENIGRPDCTIPTCGLDWITTAQPVVLDLWRTYPEQPGNWITSIGAWRGPYGSLEYQGKTYGLRVHEFRKFVSLPRLCGRRFQLALDIHSAEVTDLALLEQNGWSMIDPLAAAGDPWRYQSYIRGSRAEFMVAKNMYVQSNSGWFSDRSICYLASGRPVLAQDTGIERLYATGEGLLTFSTVDEARAAVEDLDRDYPKHARAAFSIAEAYFDSNKVLKRLLGKLGV
jgi:hypothetical protein